MTLDRQRNQIRGARPSFHEIMEILESLERIER